MSSKKIIAVFGATGFAGGSVAKYLLEDGQFAVRAITRSADGDKAKALAARGAEIVEADLAKPETLTAALQGVYGVSGLTDFWAILPTVGLDVDKAQAEEERHAKNLIDASEAAGVQHFIWFGLPHSNVPHFEGKYKAGEYLKQTGLPSTIICNSFYFENFTIPQFGMLIRGEDGTLAVNLGTPAHVYLPSYSVDETGGWILELFKQPSEYIGKHVDMIGEYLTAGRYAELLSKALGVPVKANVLSEQDFNNRANSENPYVKELYLNMKFFEEHAQPKHKLLDEAQSVKVYSKRSDFEAFLSKNPRIKTFAASLL